MKILLFGKDGQVGYELQRSLSSVGHVNSFGRSDVDLRDSEALRTIIRTIEPDFIVNAAAYTAVDRAETEREEAHLINVRAVALMAEEASLQRAWLIHYSTDYIFDGEKKVPYKEEDTPSPLNYYGVTKLAGENCIRESGCRHLILRSSWVYSYYGNNFPLAILKKARDSDTLTVVDDCQGAPTSAGLIADVTALVLYRLGMAGRAASAFCGTYHLTSRGSTSWYGFAQLLVELANARGANLKASGDKIIPTASDYYGMVAKRPKNSQLCVDKISERFDIVLPDWKDHTRLFIDGLRKVRGVGGSGFFD